MGAGRPWQGGSKVKMRPSLDQKTSTFEPGGPWHTEIIFFWFIQMVLKDAELGKKQSICLKGVCLVVLQGFLGVYFYGLKLLALLIPGVFVQH